MKNFPFEKDGKTYWYSRGIVCVMFLFATDKNDDLYILANKRGSGVSNSGEWNVPCGHLDFNETCKECAIRETFEETGVEVDIRAPKLYIINDHDFKSSDQSIGFLYYAISDKKVEQLRTTKAHMEENEVKEIEWINVDDIDKYTWAFNHDARIKQILHDII